MMHPVKEGRIILILIAALIFFAGFTLGMLAPNRAAELPEESAVPHGKAHEEATESATAPFQQDGGNPRVPDGEELGPGKHRFPGGFAVSIKEQDRGWKSFYCIDVGSMLSIDGMIDPSGMRHGAWNYSPRNTDESWIEYFWHGTHVGTDDAGMIEWGRRDNQSRR